MPPLEEIMVQAERALRVGLTIVVTYLVAVWIATIWWTFRDIHSRSTDVWLQITATLLVAVFNFPGLLIYFILRPQHTLAQSYIESLEEEGWRRSVTESGICPACQQGIEPDFLFCPSCQARLRRVCARCEHPILLRWKLCPYCGSATGSNLSEPTPFPEREPLARPSQNPQDRPD